MKRSEDIARELARSGELDPVTEAALTTPFSRRALLLSPIVLGLGLSAAPRLAAAMTYGQWVQNFQRYILDNRVLQTGWYWINETPDSTGRFHCWVRFEMECVNRSFVYGSGFSKRVKMWDNGTLLKSFDERGYEIYGKIRNDTWVKEVGDKISFEFDFWTNPGTGTHHIYSTTEPLVSDTSETCNYDFTFHLGRVTVALRPLSYRNGTQFSYPSDPSGYRGYMPEGTYLVKLCADRSKSLNVAGGYADRGTNVLLWQTDLGAAAADRLWDMFREADGRFECVHHATPCALDLYDAKAQNHQNVQQWSRNGGSAQRWRFDGSWALGTENTILIRSKVNDGFMLDVEPSSTSNGSNIDVWDKSDPSAVTCWQRWDPHLVNPDEDGTWRDVTELPDSPIRQVNFAGTKLGLYLGDRLVETATVTSNKADYASVRFSTLMTSGTSDWYNVRVLDVPATLRRQGGMHRFYIRGDVDLNVFLEYAKVGMTFKSIDEDGQVRTSASLSSLYSGWPYTSLPIPPDEANGPLNPTLHAEELIELGIEHGGYDSLAVSRYWYDRDPRVAAAKLLEVGDELVITGNETAWMRLPDTVKVHVVGGSPDGSLAWSSGPLMMRDGDTVPGPTTGAGASPADSSDHGLLFGPIESDRLWPAVASRLASESFEADRIEGWFLDEDCSRRVDAFEVAPHTEVWLRIRPYTVTYVVDGSVMATDEVPVQPAGSRSAWKVPDERTAEAAREGCTPGFSGWALSEDDPLVSGDSPSEGATGITELVVTSDVTLYGVNRATVSFARDPGSEVAADGTCLTAPDDGAAAADAVALGEIEPLTRRVGRSASLPMPSRVYHKTEVGRFVAYAPRAWHATPGSEANSSTAVVSRDMTMYVSWVAGTTDGVAAER